MQDSSLDNLEIAMGSGLLLWSLEWTSHGKPSEAAPAGRVAREGGGRPRRWSDDYRALSAIWARA